MNETNGEGSPPEEGSISATETASEEAVASEEAAPPAEVAPAAKESKKSPGFFSDPAAQKMMIYLIVVLNAALVVVGSLLPWLDEGKISDLNRLWSTVVGDLVQGYGLLTFVFGAALIAALIIKRDNSCLHLYLASAAFWAVFAFVLGPNKEEEAGVWMALSGSAVVVFVLLTHQLGEWMSEIKAGKDEAQNEDEAPAEAVAEDKAAVNKRALNAGLANLAGIGALLSTLNWDWIRFPSNAPEEFLRFFDIDRSIGAFDKPLRMALIIFAWSIVVIVGSIIVLQEPNYKKTMPNLFKAIRVSWTLAGIAICVVSGGLLLTEVFWGGSEVGGFLEGPFLELVLVGESGAFLAGPFVAFIAGVLLLVASRSEWKSDCSSETSQTTP